ncbi:MAG: DMT family transporter [Lachnospiraceae bacterium]|nr:DMT family transporter [Lachnospiraceae bacterium]
MTKPRISGEILVFLGAVCWSLNSPLVKYLTLDSLLICGLRSVIAAVALLAFIRPKKLKFDGWMLLYVISYAAVCLSVIVSLTMTSAPIAIGMQYTATVWLFLAACIRTKRFDGRAFLPVLVIMIGVIFFMMSGTDAKSNTGNLIALSEGVFFALMTVSSKKAGGENPLGLTAIANIFTGIIVFVLFPSVASGIPAMTGRDWIVMLILGVVQVGFGYGLYNMGVQKVSPQKASILALWEMILGPVWVAIFLREYPSIPVLIGFTIVLIGMVLDARRKKPSVAQAEEAA